MGMSRGGGVGGLVLWVDAPFQGSESMGHGLSQAMPWAPVEVAPLVRRYGCVRLFAVGAEHARARPTLYASTAQDTARAESQKMITDN